MRLEVGRIVKAHGLRGEVAVVAITDRHERFAPGSVLYAGDEAVTVATARPHGDRWLVRFEGDDDRDRAEARRGVVLTAEAVDEPDDGLWVHEVVGVAVVDRAGVEVGTVVSVEANPAHDLLVLDSGALVPVVFVVEHDGRRIVVDLPEGLLDLSG